MRIKHRSVPELSCCWEVIISRIHVARCGQQEASFLSHCLLITSLKMKLTFDGTRPLNLLSTCWANDNIKGALPRLS